MTKVQIEDIELDLTKLNKKLYELPKKVLKYLNDYLLPDEDIELSLRGAWGTERRGSQTGDKASGEFLFFDQSAATKAFRGYQWLIIWGYSWLVITNKRLIMTTKGIMTTETRDFTYDKISSVDYEKGFLTDRLTIHAMSSVEDIFFYKNVVSVSRKLPAIIRSRIDRAAKKTELGPPSENPLKILKMRLARGEISKEEFEDLKHLL
ncbi:Bacterial PH domain protein [Candidatus Methanoperedenaceae archaeon GB37]|nr:Bacterial PH domain protein [Candidatus Methanoperedenaceae archaeon GB37]